MAHRARSAPPLSELADAGRLLVERGLVQASGGNLSVRAGDAMWITGSGAWLDKLDAESFVRMGFDGQSDGRGLPSSEWLLHARIYQARPDVGCVLHLHPQTSLLLDALGKPIRFLTQDHMIYVGSYGRTPYFANGSTELADSAAAELANGHHQVVLMGNHGIAAVGSDVEWALRRALNFEEAALMTYRALLLGDSTTTFPPDRLPLLGEH